MPARKQKCKGIVHDKAIEGGKRPCKGWAMNGHEYCWRCYQHPGGRPPSTGLRTRAKGIFADRQDHLTAAYERSLEKPDQLFLDEHIALADAVIVRLREAFPGAPDMDYIASIHKALKEGRDALNKGESDKFILRQSEAIRLVEDALKEMAVAREILAALDERRRLSEAQMKIRLAAENVVTMDVLEGMIAFLFRRIDERVVNVAEKTALVRDICSFTGIELAKARQAKLLPLLEAGEVEEVR